MNRVSIILFFFLLCLAPSIAYPNENAKTLFKQKKYQEALDLWTNELKQGKQNDALHYNIGLAHLKLNQFPQSILHLEIALKLNPNCKPCLAALQLANQNAEIEEFKMPEYSISKWYQYIMNSLNSILWLALASFFFSIAILIYFKKSTLSKLQWICIVAGILFLLFAIHREYNITKIDKVVVLDGKGLFQSPDQSSEVKIQLNKGSVLKIKDQLGDWLKVETNSYESGWIETKKISFIKL